MWTRIFNWKYVFALIFIFICIATIVFTTFLSKKIAADELQKVNNYIVALAQDDPTPLVIEVLKSNKDIPILVTNYTEDTLLDVMNIDSNLFSNNMLFLKTLNQLKAENSAFLKIAQGDSTYNKLFHGHTTTYKQIKYFPYVLVVFLSLFVGLLAYTLRTQYTSTQNQIWAGMAKETAHQLGTPISSLQAWLTLAADGTSLTAYLPDIEKDVERLKLVSERFGKIGSQPKLIEKNIYTHVNQIMEYMQKRASGNIVFNLKTDNKDALAVISPELFDWVLENLIKNALDSIEGKGNITIKIKNTLHKNIIAITDTGKGIDKKYWAKVFAPGYTTKKRGWGLGLTLCKRIITEYHKGNIYVKNSTLGVGSTFCIELSK